MTLQQRIHRAIKVASCPYVIKIQSMQSVHTSEPQSRTYDKSWPRWSKTNRALDAADRSKHLRQELAQRCDDYEYSLRWTRPEIDHDAATENRTIGATTERLCGPML